MAGECGEAALHLLVVAQGGFAQTEETFLPEVVQTDTVAPHPIGHRCCQRHVTDDEQTGIGGQLVELVCYSFRLLSREDCCLVRVNILSHFRIIINNVSEMRQPAVRYFEFDGKVTAKDCKPKRKAKNTSICTSRTSPAQVLYKRSTNIGAERHGAGGGKAQSPNRWSTKVQPTRHRDASGSAGRLFRKRRALISEARGAYFGSTGRVGDNGVALRPPFCRI